MPTKRIGWRHQYDPEIDHYIGEATATHNPEPSLTQQQFKEDADLNVIVKRLRLGQGAPIPLPTSAAAYGDFGDPFDFRDALDRVRDAQERFAALPAAIRARFHNNPVALFEFVNNKANAEESVRLGLLRKATPPKAEPPVPPVE